MPCIETGYSGFKFLDFQPNLSDLASEKSQIRPADHASPYPYRADTHGEADRIRIQRRVFGAMEKSFQFWLRIGVTSVDYA